MSAHSLGTCAHHLHLTHTEIENKNRGKGRRFSSFFSAAKNPFPLLLQRVRLVVKVTSQYIKVVVYTINAAATIKAAFICRKSTVTRSSDVIYHKRSALNTRPNSWGEKRGRWLNKRAFFFTKLYRIPVIFSFRLFLRCLPRIINWKIPKMHSGYTICILEERGRELLLLNGKMAVHKIKSVFLHCFSWHCSRYKSLQCNEANVTLLLLIMHCKSTMWMTLRLRDLIICLFVYNKLEKRSNFHIPSWVVFQESKVRHSVNKKEVLIDHF